MADIIRFELGHEPAAAGEALYKSLDHGWKLVRITDGDALARELSRMKRSDALDKEDREKVGRSDYLFLCVRDPDQENVIFLTVRQSDKWIEELRFSQAENQIEALRVLAPVVAEMEWRKLYRWDDGYMMTSAGEVVSVNALPDTLAIRGHVGIFKHTEVSLPDRMFVEGDVFLHTCSFKKTPRHLTCGNLDVVGCTMSRIAENLKTSGKLKIAMSNIHEIAEVAGIGSDMELSHMDHQVRMPRILRVGNDFASNEVIVQGFGEDTVILGALSIATRDDIERFALDFAGRVIGSGDCVRIVDAPETDAAGARIRVRDRWNVEGFFSGKTRDGWHSCHIIDDEDGRVHTALLARRSIISTCRVSPPENVIPGKSSAR